MIELKNVTFTYQTVNAEGEEVCRDGVHGLDMQIKDGEFVVLTGGSGCGKTTITRLINGLIPHYYEGKLSGEVIVNDMNTAETQISKLSRYVGSIFQNPRSQFFNVNTTDEISFAAENQCRDPEQIISDISATSQKMQIDDLLDRNIFELSGGEKQMIACAGVNVLSPDIIVLDEPTSNLDFQAIEKLKKVLSDWKEQGKTIIIAEHRLHFLRELADRMLILEKGRIAKELSATEIRALTKSDTDQLGIRPLELDRLPYDNKPKNSTENIVFKDFVFTYKDGEHGINIPELIVPKNTVIAVIGHNGAGKSTFVRCLCGLEKKCKGIVTMNGKVMKNKHRLHSCYMIMQDVNHQLFTESVKDEIMLSMADKTLADEQKEDEAIEILSQLDLAEQSELHPMALSGGQKQRTAIASGIASSKEILIFDEPTSGLDLVHMGQVAAELKRLKAMGKTIFVVTHDPELIAACCEYVVWLENGRIADSFVLDEEGAEKVRGYFGILHVTQ